MQLSLFPDLLTELSTAAALDEQEHREAARRARAANVIPVPETLVVKVTPPKTPSYTRPLGGNVATEIDVNGWKKWSWHQLKCPECPGKLNPTAKNAWQCTLVPEHKAFDYMNMLALRVMGGVRCWVPGLFGDQVIPVGETAVVEEIYLLEPVCAFCLSDLVRIAPRGWECSASGMHRFWVHQGCGVWSNTHGESILKKAPLWAKEMMKL